MIGVTGTKGKTTVAYLMRSVLKAAGCVVGMVGTVEIDDGREVVPAEMTTPGAVELVALFSRMKRNGVTHCVMEVSSHALHQDRVAGIDFDVAMFTNLTGDHLDYHGTMEEYAAAKARLFEGLKPQAAAMVNVDDAFGIRMIQDCQAGVVRIGLEGGSVRKHWMRRIESMTSSAMRLVVTGPGGRGPSDVHQPLITKLIGKHNAYNLLCVAAGARALNLTLAQSGPALEHAPGAPGRLQRVDGQDNGFEVFVDYAHTHDSLENVLRALKETTAGGRLICVFGCGGDRDRTKRPKMGAVAERLADVVIVTSDNPRTEIADAIIEEICAGFSQGWREAGKISVEPDRRAAIRRAIAAAEAGDVVLIAGKGHENYQIIGTTKHHFDDVEEAAAAMSERPDLTTKARRHEGAEENLISSSCLRVFVVKNIFR